MSKFNFAVYPAVAVLSLAAAFSAHAQSANDPVDQAAYGAMAVAPVAARSAVKSAQTALMSNRSVREFDPVDHAGYGPMVANTTSIRTRAEVRAEAIAARNAGYDANYREGGDAGYAYAPAAKTVAADPVVAGTSVKTAQ